jgi:hypothetical protein
MKRPILTLTWAVVALGTSTARPAEIPEIMSQDREMAMALGAAPEHLHAEAGVYVLKTTGFVRVRESRNGFTCIVNRDHPKALKPTCWDAEGTATIVPKVLRVGELLMQGKSLAEIDQDIAEGFRTGRFRPPSRPGVAYMLSGDIRNVTAAGTSSFPPHVMIYAPNLTNSDIGVTPEALAKNPSLPFIAYQGPHGYFIVSVASQGTPAAAADSKPHEPSKKNP